MMDQVLASTLQAAVIGRLDYLDRLGTDADEPSRAALATTEITRLAAAWRDLLDQHAPTSTAAARSAPSGVTPAPASLFGLDHRPPAPDRRRRSSRGRTRQARGCRRTADRRGAGGLLTGGRAVAPNTARSPVLHVLSAAEVIHADDLTTLAAADHATGSWP